MIHNILYFSKNSNENQVYLSVNVENNKFVPFKTGIYKDYLINLEWKTKKEDGTYYREDLGKIDQYIYGYKILESTDTTISFQADKLDRTILIKLNNNQVKIYTRINNNAAEIYNIYSHIDGDYTSISLTSILKFKKLLQYVILRGKDSNGNNVQEKIMNN